MHPFNKGTLLTENCIPFELSYTGSFSRNNRTDIENEKPLAAYIDARTHEISLIRIEKT
jgi:hypothetical protein